MPKTVKRRRREEHIFFEDGRFSVTDRNLKTPRRTYRIATIEKIALRRDPFYFALALSIPAVGLIFAFNQYLYNYERVILAGGSALALALTSRLGVLFVESKALAEMAAVASMPTLRQVREAVEAAIDDFHEQDHDADDD